MDPSARTVGCVLFAILALALAAASAFLALISGGAVGGVAMGVAPEPTFGLVQPLICSGGELNFYSVKRSFHEPGEAEPHLECLSPEGESRDVLLAGIAAVLGGSFLAIFAGTFLTLFVPVALVAAFLLRRTQGPLEAAADGKR